VAHILQTQCIAVKTLKVKALHQLQNHNKPQYKPSYSTTDHKKTALLPLYQQCKASNQLLTLVQNKATVDRTPPPSGTAPWRVNWTYAVASNLLSQFQQQKHIFITHSKLSCAIHRSTQDTATAIPTEKDQVMAIDYMDRNTVKFEDVVPEICMQQTNQQKYTDHHIIPPH